MYPLRIAIALSLAVVLRTQDASAQDAGPWMDLPALSRAVRAKQPPDAVKSTVDKLLAEAGPLQAAGRTGEARRRLANAWTLVNGRAWDQKEEFVWSLALRTDKAVADSALPVMARLTQIYPALTPSGLKLRVSLAGKDAGMVDITSRDLIDQPAGLEISLDGAPDGEYKLTAEVLENGAAIAHLEHRFQLVQGIETQRASVEKRLARIQGHESAKASVRYPFDVAHMVNTGRRRLWTNDFGLREDGTQTFDFAKEYRDSAAILKALEAGKDPLFRAKGDHERRYYFEEAGEIMPYRVYVPSKWDGKSKLKMLFVLHGNTRDHDFYFDRDNGILAKLAEQYGWLAVCPMGYRPNAGYNAIALRTLTGTAAPQRALDAARQRETELSEKDAMNVFDLVTKEYPIDMEHIYLFGHSAGGTGGWYIAAKYPEKFAGIALSAFGTRADSYPFDRIKGKPVMVIVGTKDAPNTVANVRAMAKAVAGHGFDNEFLEVEGATHDTIVGLAEPKVFAFFAKR